MALRVSRIFLPSDPNELSDKLKLLLQKKEAAKKSNIINDENIAIVDKYIEHNCISRKQQERNLIQCNLLDTKKSK